MPRGGARPNSGRKPRAFEIESQKAAMDAMLEKFGTPHAAFGALLESGEPSLIKFAYEWAFGKPTERIEQSGEMELIWSEVKTYEAKP